MNHRITTVLLAAVLMTVSTGCSTLLGNRPAKSKKTTSARATSEQPASLASDFDGVCVTSDDEDGLLIEGAASFEETVFFADRGGHYSETVAKVSIDGVVDPAKVREAKRKGQYLFNLRHARHGSDPDFVTEDEEGNTWLLVTKQGVLDKSIIRRVNVGYAIEGEGDEAKMCLALPQ